MIDQKIGQSSKREPKDSALIKRGKKGKTKSMHSRVNPPIPTPLKSLGGKGGLMPLDSREFKIVSFDKIERKEIEFIIPGMIPKDSAVVLIGEEGIGKSLLVYWLIALITKMEKPQNVLLIAGEDDPQRVIRGRLEVAGAELSRVHVLALETETLSGHPMFPTDIPQVKLAIQKRNISVVFIDPWLSVVPGSLQVKDTQQARQALDPINALARECGVSVVLVTHTNRQTGVSSRSRYGATIALRQAARFCMMAISDPSDSSKLLVGIEKSNLGEKSNAQCFEKVSIDGTVKLIQSSEEIGMQIDELLDTFERNQDQRTTDRWNMVEEVAKESGGQILRQEVVRIYEDAGSSAKAADKAIERWTSPEAGRLKRTDTRGLYKVIDFHPEPPVNSNSDTQGVA